MTTILVVDDEWLIAAALEGILQDEGYRVLTAINGRQGLDRLAEAEVDLVLLDMMMPVMSGPDMLGAMRADARHAAIPVVVTSSLPDATVRATLGGSLPILRKPYSARTLLQLIADTLRAAKETR
jgi:CheY-like chemotaxis protein